MPSRTFKVDASLLEELGERLIGKAPIALAELIKNAYDADASTCRIEIADESIVVTDDGSGMSDKQFLDYWMRIGTTHKVDEKTSPGGRPLTGSKGIGRLSVQFLAEHMTLESTSGSRIPTLRASIDWTQVVRGKELASVSVTYRTQSDHPAYPHDSATGTRITLTELKSAWDKDDLELLGREVWLLRSPFRPSARRPSKKRRAEEFSIELSAPDIEGAAAAFDIVSRALFGNWKARITGSLDGGRQGDSATVTVEFKSGYPAHDSPAKSYSETVTLPIREEDHDKPPMVDRAQFEILIFNTEGRQADRIPVGDLRAYLAKYGNVSVYDTTFRLPYYGGGRDSAGQDWLSIALDQGRRLNASELLPARLRATNKYMQDLPAPGRIFGAVDIDTNHERIAASRAKAKNGTWLQIQPGRDRLHDNGAYDQLRDLVRFALDYYANRHRLRSYAAAEARQNSESAVTRIKDVIDLLEDHRHDLPQPVYAELKREVTAALKSRQTEEELLDRRAALLAPLATAGMTALALSHELGRETLLLERSWSRLRVLAKKHGIPELAELAEEFTTAAKRLRSIQDVFAPLVAEADGQAEERLKVLPIVRQAIGGMSVLMPNISVSARGIPPDLRFPTGSFAEWSAVLQNVLANAWNASLSSPGARIWITAGQDGARREYLRVNDSGVGLGVPLEESIRLFEPFERALTIAPDQRSIALGGQGLGLSIVRMIAHRRGATVAFVGPEAEATTTFQLSWTGVSK